MQISLPAPTVERLEELRQQTGKESVTNLIQDAVEALLARQAQPARTPGGEELTPRLREVLRLIAMGKSTKEIAAALGISVKTADWHRTRLMQALDLHDIASLVRYAIRTGMIEP